MSASLNDYEQKLIYVLCSLACGFACPCFVSLQLPSWPWNVRGFDRVRVSRCTACNNWFLVFS